MNQFFICSSPQQMPNHIYLLCFLFFFCSFSNLFFLYNPLCLSQGEINGLEGFPVGEKQKKYHYGVISCQQNNPAPYDVMLYLIYDHCFA